MIKKGIIFVSIFAIFYIYCLYVSARNKREREEYRANLILCYDKNKSMWKDTTNVSRVITYPTPIIKKDKPPTWANVVKNSIVSLYSSAQNKYNSFCFDAKAFEFNFKVDDFFTHEKAPIIVSFNNNLNAPKRKRKKEQTHVNTEVVSREIISMPIMPSMSVPRGRRDYAVVNYNK